MITSQQIRGIKNINTVEKYHHLIGSYSSIFQDHRQNSHIFKAWKSSYQIQYFPGFPGCVQTLFWQRRALLTERAGHRPTWHIETAIVADCYLRDAVRTEDVKTREYAGLLVLLVALGTRVFRVGRVRRALRARCRVGA